MENAIRELIAVLRPHIVPFLIAGGFMLFLESIAMAWPPSIYHDQRMGLKPGATVVTLAGDFDTEV